MKLLRAKLVETIEKFDKEMLLMNVLVIAVMLPTGAIEIITNYQHINSKIRYILDNYDEHLQLKANNDIKILDFIIL